MTTRKLAVVTSGLSTPSSTRMLADRLAEATREKLVATGTDVDVTTIEVRDLAHSITNNMLTGFADDALQGAIDAVTGADGLIAVSPVFKTSYAGLFKSFIDVIDNTALTDLPVVVGATGGTPRHSLALDFAMRPLFTYMHSVVVPTGVYAASDDWGAGAETVKALPERIDRAARELAALMEHSTRSENVVDPFALDENFDQLLGGFQGN
ncbi:FMN reductase [Paramicrobacterium agarici]|uniref:FMN reductase n=1 Tax=Paramicrobacterium agarici TaxID=630514 RepID=UPI00114E0ACE|nr:FMN reductase [Microbacterium agarici]TQO24075.1 FMN reductase [Microbacterium agarici]